MEKLIKMNKFKNIFFNNAVSPFTKIYGIGRSVLAFGTLLTLLCNSDTVIFSAEKLLPVNHHNIDVINLFVLIGYHHLWLSKLIAIIILLAVIAGIYPKITGMLHWWVSFSVFHGLLILDGGDQVTMVLTFFLIFITVLDKRKNHWSEPVAQSPVSRYIGNIFLLIIRVQISILYLVAALSKLHVHEWVDGSAMYYFLTDNSFAAPDYLMWLVKPVVSNSAMSCILTWGSIGFEFIMAAAILLNENIRRKLFKAAILFHLLIFIFMGIGSLFFAMAGSLVLYLYPNKKIDPSVIKLQEA